LQYLTSILVSLDGSAYAEQALPLATGLVRMWGSRLRLVSVHTPATTWNAGGEFPLVDHDLDQQLREQEQSYLTEVAARITADGDLDIECTVLDGRVAEAIVNFVQQTRTDMVVLTSHGRGGLGRIVLGNTADQLVRRLEVPVLVVRAGQDAQQGPHRILVPLDGSALSDSIMEQAKTVARVTRSELLLAMILQPLPILLPPFLWPPEKLTEPRELRERAGRTYLELWKKQLAGEGFAVQSRVRTARKVAKEILQLVKDEECGMIAMATHGASGLDRVMLGSVTDQVLRHAQVPVLVLRPVLPASAKDESLAGGAAELIAH
jgi:nucleotide-binding universal stress UspA family protein